MSLRDIQKLFGDRGDVAEFRKNKSRPIDRDSGFVKGFFRWGFSLRLRVLDCASESYEISWLEEEKDPSIHIEFRRRELPAEDVFLAMRAPSVVAVR